MVNKPPIPASGLKDALCTGLHLGSQGPDLPPYLNGLARELPVFVIAVLSTLGSAAALGSSVHPTASLPFTAGDWDGVPARVFAPHR